MIHESFFNTLYESVDDIHYYHYCPTLRLHAVIRANCSAYLEILGFPMGGAY